MNIEYKYSVVWDLMYHVLAHMHVENASNLYSEAYIDTVEKVKSGRFDSITDTVSHLSNYYNENFGRLAVINFLPLVCSSVQEFISAAENYSGFTEADREHFLFPLIQLLKNEFVFYEDYWNSLYNTTCMCRKAFESQLSNELRKYEALFSYFNKSVVVGVSYSLTCNGRGYEDASSFHAIVPFALDESKYKNSFYQVLHEFTHQFTDKLLSKNITMEDETHALSEKAAILFDYYLIQQFNKSDADSYLNWVSFIANISNCTESVFLSSFQVNEDIHKKLLELVERIKAEAPCIQ